MAHYHLWRDFSGGRGAQGHDAEGKERTPCNTHPLAAKLDAKGIYSVCGSLFFFSRSLVIIKRLIIMLISIFCAKSWNLGVKLKVTYKTANYVSLRLQMFKFALLSTAQVTYFMKSHIFFRFRLLEMSRKAARRVVASSTRIISIIHEVEKV